MMNDPMEDFDLDRSTAESWQRFTARLAEVLSVMDAGATLTLRPVPTTGSQPEPGLTFRGADGGVLTAEFPGNDLLGEEAVGLEGLELLAAHGWEPPGADSEGLTSHHRLVSDQEGAEQLAVESVVVLRDILLVPHPAFLVADELAELLAPPAPSETDPRSDDHDTTAVVVTSLDHLRSLVTDELAHVLGYPPIADDDGDLAIRVGSAMVLVRCAPDAREVIVFSPLVHDLEGRTRAVEVLGDLNTEHRFVRFLMIRDRAYVSMSLLARPFVSAHLHQAMELVSLVADQLDQLLADKLRGRTSFGSDEPE